MEFLNGLIEMISGLRVEIPLVILVAAGGAFIQRVSGFGFGIFVMIFLPYILPEYGPATVLSSAMGLVMSTQVAIEKRKYINWKLVVPCFATAMITTVLAVAFMKGQSSELLKGLLGGTLIVLSVYFIFFSKKLRIKANIPAGLGAGALSGVMGGLFSMSGPPIVVYMINAAASATEYLATIQAYFVLNGVFSIATKIVAGFLTPQVVVLWVFGAIGSFIGTRVGGKVFDKLNPERIKQIAYVVMAISGVVTVLSVVL